MKKQIKLIAALATAGIVITASSANAATTLVNEDFQTSPLNADGTGSASAGWTGWTFDAATSVKSRISTADIPEDTNFPGSNLNQVMQMENITTANYALSHNWTTDDVYNLSFNASPQAWELPKERFAVARIFETGTDTLLWEQSSALPTAEGLAWNGPGLYGNSSWQAEPGSLYSHSIDASTFTAGTAGTDIYLQLTMTGTRGMYYDNVVMTVDAVPEPSTTAILGLGGLALIFRRRK